MEEKIKMFSLKTIIYFLIAFLFLHIFATFYHLYWLFPWLDVPMHFLGGLLLVIIYFWINARIEILNPKFNKLPKWLVNLVFALSFVILIGVLWEFYEFLHDFYLLTGGKISVFQNSFADTIKDLFFDLVGGTTAFAIFYRKLIKLTNS